MNANSPKDSWPFALGLILLLCLSLWISWPALTGPFLFDDFPNLSNLSTLQGVPTWHRLATYVAQYSGEPGRPLAMLSFVINDAAWPSDPFSFKYTNLLLHLLVGVVVFGMCRSLAETTANARQSNVAAIFAASAWLLHPMQFSTSMLVVQRMTQLSALFTISAAWGYVAIAKRAKRPQQAVLAIAVLGLGTILAVLCKETGALTPLLAVVLNATLLRSRLGQSEPATRSTLRWGSAIPVVALGIALAFKWSSLTDFGSRDFTMYERLLSESRALTSYLFSIIVPSLNGSGIYHDDFAVSRGLLQPWTTFPAVLFITALIWTGAASLRRHPLLSFGILWFLAGHALESSVFPLELYFEHRNYVPMIGPLFSLGVTVATMQGKWRLLAPAAAGLWIAAAAFLTSIQAPIWGNEGALTRIWLAEHPHSPRAVQQRAFYLGKIREPHAAAQLLLAAYNAGMRGADFPLQVVSLSCTIHNKELAGQAWPAAIAMARSGSYSNATLDTVTRLRQKASDGACQDVISREQWLDLTKQLLANGAYQASATQAYLHVERGYYFMAQRDLNSTMNEFEQAWAENPQPQIARLIAGTLASAGLYDDAVDWSDQAIAHRTPGIRGWISSDLEESIRLRDELLQIKGLNAEKKMPR